MAFLTGGRMVREISGGRAVPGGALTLTGDEGLVSTTVGMLVMDDGVGTARGVAVIERGVGGLGLAPRGEGGLTGLDNTTVCIVPSEPLACPFCALFSGAGSGSESNIARADGKRLAIS